MGERVTCRARIAEGCAHGSPAALYHLYLRREEDTTWDGHSVICDACYIALGGPHKRRPRGAGAGAPGSEGLWAQGRTRARTASIPPGIMPTGKERAPVVPAGAAPGDSAQGAAQSVARFGRALAEARARLSSHHRPPRRPDRIPIELTAHELSLTAEVIAREAERPTHASADNTDTLTRIARRLYAAL